MQITVHHVRKSPKGYPIAYGQVGDKTGEVWAAPEVTEPGVYELKSRLVVKQGRFTVQLRAEKS